MRILVDRLWPRGVSKERLRLTAWAKEIAPSRGICDLFHDRRMTWEEFRASYLAELAENPHTPDFLATCSAPVVTLIFGSKDAEKNNAVVLRAYLQGNMTRDG